jgi:hypothetical protein
MFDSSVITRLFARLRALLPKDWQETAGDRFRRTLHDISEFASQNRVEPKALAEEAVTLGRMKIEGLAAKSLLLPSEISMKRRRVQSPHSCRRGHSIAKSEEKRPRRDWWN